MEPRDIKKKEVLANMPHTIIRILLRVVSILLGRNVIQKMRLKRMPNMNI